MGNKPRQPTDPVHDQVFDEFMLEHNDNFDPCAIRDCLEQVLWIAGPFCAKHDAAIRKMMGAVIL